jgi:ribosomal protein S6E (S10)
VGRPSGALNKEHARLKQLARAHTDKAIAELAAIMVDRKGQTTRDRITAAVILLDRGWGKPSQELQFTGGTDADGAPLPMSLDVNVENLSTDELKNLENLMVKANAPTKQN